MLLYACAMVGYIYSFVQFVKMCDVCILIH